MERIRNLICPLLVVLLAATSLRAADVLDSDVLSQVPRDALAIAVVRNLSQADAKAGKVLGALGSRLPGPLAFLRSIAGLDAGLDTRRDLLVALLPPENNSRQYHLAVWLPIKDYDTLVRSLDGDPQRRIAAVTLAGEDLLVVRQDDWAVIMDTDQRDRLERLQEGATSPPPQLEEWSDWIEANDAVFVVLPAGMRTAWSRAVAEGLFDAAKPTTPTFANDDDLFGPVGKLSPVGSGWPAVRSWIQTTFAESPELARWIGEAESAACGLRLDDEGSVLAGVRLELSPSAMPAVSASVDAAEVRPIPRLFDGGPFIGVGSGQVATRWIVPAVAPYVRQVANELATQFGNKVQETDVAEFRQATDRAVAKVHGFSVLTLPGTAADGVYTNSFLALRVAETHAFLQECGELIKIWNAMIGKTEGSKMLTFDSQPIAIAGHQGTEYSIDMLAAVNVPAIPEIKASMEKLFGPGGKFRMLCVEVDDQTVLLAAATEAQAAEVLGTMLSDTRPTGDPAEIRPAAELMTGASQWQMYVSPHGYTDWLRRQLDAILGAVIGGPIVPQFPESPPIGLSGGVEGRMLWTEVAVPVETLRGYRKFSPN